MAEIHFTISMKEKNEPLHNLHEDVTVTKKTPGTQVNQRGDLNSMHQMQNKKTRKLSSPSLSYPNKSTNAMEELKRKNKRGG